MHLYLVTHIAERSQNVKMCANETYRHLKARENIPLGL